MEWVTGRIVIEADGPLLIGGHTEAPAFLDAGTARRLLAQNKDRSKQKPIIPGSALRGALREALTRWLNSQDVPAPAPWEKGSPESPLTRLFGSRGADRPGMGNREGMLDEVESPSPEGARPGLRIDDATLDAGEPEFSVRHGVGVDRYTGHAVEGRLFQREVADVEGARFVAHFEGNVERKDLDRLIEACALVDSIGNSRSRGLGAVRVRMEVDERAATSSPPVTIGALQEDTDTAVVVLHAESDLHLGDVPDRTSFRESLPFVPGSALRGALVWALVDAGLRGAEGFDELAEGALFSDLWPSDKEPCGPAPRTVMACKAHTSRVDTILMASLLPYLLKLGGAPETWKCPKCGEPLKPATGLLDPKGEEQSHAITRIVTRLALDPKTSSAALGMLHARQQIVAGTRFAGTVGKLGPKARALLARLDRPIRLGGLRTRGLGRVRVELQPFRRSELKEAAKAFDEAARALIPEALADEIGFPGKAWVQLVARTPLYLPNDQKPDAAGEWLAGELFGSKAVAVASHQRTDTRSGWADSWKEGQRSGNLPVHAVIRAGSTWLFRLSEPLNDADITKLVEAATEGVGKQRELGLGRLVPPPKLPLHPSDDRGQP